MAIVITLDQRASRRAPDRVSLMQRELNRLVRPALRFVRTAGDEMQGVVKTGDDLAAVAARCLEDGGWWIGIGIGKTETSSGRTAREGRGPAFWNAREALRRAHKQKAGTPGPVAVVADQRFVAENLEAALSALAFIVMRRTARQREAVALARKAPGLRAVADPLGISASAVSQLLRAAGFEEQNRLEGLIARLVDEVS